MSSMALVDLVFALLAAAAPAPEVGPGFLFPAKCEFGKSCLIQKYFDHDPSAGRRDYSCGQLTTNGHDGTDIRVRTLADMRSGVTIVAAKEGRVLRVRDGEPDTGSGARAEGDGKDAGNGVVIDHGDGWETQYSHMGQGSLKVRPGQKVAAGEPLGSIGLSGNSEFPHLHFTVRKDGVAVDPFLPLGASANCGSAASAPSLWERATAVRLAYAPAGAISAGLASAVPPRGVMERDPPPALVDPRGPIILWVDVFGAKAGDRQEFTILAPDGAVLHRQADVLTDGGLSWFTYSGKRPGVGTWPKGLYTGRYRLSRGDKAIGEIAVTALMN